eukprot:12241773-Heterocapsa_arctica.AAC.2
MADRFCSSAASASSHPPSLRRSSAEYLARSATVGRTRLAEYDVTAAASSSERPAGGPRSSWREKAWNLDMCMLPGRTLVTLLIDALGGPKSFKSQGASS